MLKGHDKFDGLLAISTFAGLRSPCIHPLDARSATARATISISLRMTSIVRVDLQEVKGHQDRFRVTSEVRVVL